MGILPEEWVFGRKIHTATVHICPYNIIFSFLKYENIFGHFDSLAETREFGQNTYPDILMGKVL